MAIINTEKNGLTSGNIHLCQPENKKTERDHPKFAIRKSTNSNAEPIFVISGATLNSFESHSEREAYPHIDQEYIWVK